MEEYIICGIFLFIIGAVALYSLKITVAAIFSIFQKEDEKPKDKKK